VDIRPSRKTDVGPYLFYYTNCKYIVMESGHARNALENCSCPCETEILQVCELKQDVWDSSSHHAARTEFNPCLKLNGYRSL